MLTTKLEIALALIVLWGAVIGWIKWGSFSRQLDHWRKEHNVEQARADKLQRQKITSERSVEEERRANRIHFERAENNAEAYKNRAERSETNASAHLKTLGQIYDSKLYLISLECPVCSIRQYALSKNPPEVAFQGTNLKNLFHSCGHCSGGLTLEDFTIRTETDQGQLRDICNPNAEPIILLPLRREDEEYAYHTSGYHEGRTHGQTTATT